MVDDVPWGETGRIMQTALNRPECARRGKGTGEADVDATKCWLTVLSEEATATH